jgi:hypothetical protein
MSIETVVPLSLPTAWTDAIEQVRRRRSKLHYKPAALLVALDLLDGAAAGAGLISPRHLVWIHPGGGEGQGLTLVDEG